MTIDHNIRNIESHVDKNEKIKIFSEGFMIDKTKSPAVFSLVTGKGERIKSINISEIKIRRKKSQAFRNIQKKMTSDEWEELHRRHTKLGLQGELFVLDKEMDTVDETLKGRIIHESQLNDAAGYDILSIDKKGKEKYIEVKTTKRKINEPFFISENELNYLKLHISNSYIYRVYEFDENTLTGKLIIIKAKDLLNNKKYRISPNTYRVIKK